MYLADADAEGDRLPALVAAVEHRAVLQPPGVVRLHSPIGIKKLPGRLDTGLKHIYIYIHTHTDHGELALLRRCRRRGRRIRAQRASPRAGTPQTWPPLPPGARGTARLHACGGRGRRSSWATGVRLGDAEEEAGQRRGGGGCPAQLYSTGWIGAVEAESRRAPIAPAIAVETHGRMSSCGVCVFLRW
jgi:hypothetical protein